MRSRASPIGTVRWCEIAESRVYSKATALTSVARGKSLFVDVDVVFFSHLFPRFMAIVRSIGTSIIGIPFSWPSQLTMASFGD